MMRGASSLLYSIPRRGRLTNDVQNLSSRPTTCFSSGTPSQEMRSEPTSMAVSTESQKSTGRGNGHTSQNPLASPILLLEGDELFLSDRGVARTYYEIDINSDKEQVLKTCQPLGLEEQYDLKRSRKTFTLRRSAPGMRCEVGTKLMGPSLIRLDLEEIDHGVFGSAGTGATTWEASIAMSLFWSSHADLLLENVIELGSGVGLGGILSGLIGATSLDSRMASMTLTDHNQEVLDQCTKNVRMSQREAIDQLHRNTDYSIAHLDWYDFLTNSGNCEDHRGHYDTVIASDCAYRYQDLAALARAMKGLLKPERNSRIHFFGPYNRGALHDLVSLLRCQKLELAMEYVDIKRYRLYPQDGQSKPLCNQNTLYADMSAIASQATSKFLHVTASHNAKDLSESTQELSLAEID